MTPLFRQEVVTLGQRLPRRASRRFRFGTMKRFAILFVFVMPWFRPLRSGRNLSDHLVLQQNYGNPIWGWAQPEKVTVPQAGERTLADHRKTGNGWRWSTPPPSRPWQPSGSNRIVLRRRG